MNNRKQSPSPFLWPFMQKIKALIITNDNALVSGLLIDYFKLEIIVPKRDKESPKSSEGLPLSLPITITDTQNNTEDKGNMDSTMELKMTVIHQRQIPGQH